MAKNSAPIGNFSPSELDEDDGSAEDPNSNLAAPLKLLNPAQVDQLIAAVRAEAQAQALPNSQINAALGLLTTVLPALAVI